MSLTEALIASGNCSNEEEARKEIAEARIDLLAQVAEGDSDAFEFCADRWGLEPDYLDELITL